MTAPVDASRSIARTATRCGFFMAGFGLAVWAPLVPYVRERIEMSDALFGVLLLCIGIGSLSWMPLSGLLVSRLGIRPVVLGAVALLGVALVGMALADSVWLMALALFCFGGSLGVIDVVLNIQSVLVETAVGRRMMSNFHGMFSLGAIVGALAMTLQLSMGLSAEFGTLSMTAVVVIANLSVARGFLPNRAPGGGLAFVRPRGLVLLAGLLCFAVYLAEGAVLDWSALYLTGEKSLEVSLGGLGYAAYTLMVTIARFGGAPVINRLGPARVIALGGLVAALGIALTLSTTSWPLALLGYGLCGLGCANVAPVLISSLSRQTIMPMHTAVTVATTIGFAGVLAGPALMGVVAQLFSLGAAFFMLMLLLLGIIPASRRFSD
ncbi:MFS transporter [Stutzerimonas balearica]|jgi:MFS family permease|uniref:Fucose permease n=2 Tax=Stutzerimonas balearica TaxID=74829 RepID=A0A8D4C1E8_9GAMM|nr:MFS transporter [Stutzerimonas balearica]MBB60774.1 MFS transporter [Pseudomonas sp.]AJE15217.1 MFS transporter [Stutzerimonas balearica DSM 6083]MBC7199532.1 MFS transporter [Stutzerimonas balearica]MBS4150449.1 MFS transporter [Stutzerimonas balearica]MCF6757256.1 MFS transporter [Stutzerimonas balearica]